MTATKAARKVDRDKPLTRRQLRVLLAVLRFALKHGRYATQTELMPLLGIATIGGVTAAMRPLERKGYLVSPGSGYRLPGLEFRAANDAAGLRLWRVAFGEELA